MGGGVAMPPILGIIPYMVIDDKIRKCVVFVAAKKTNGEYCFVGTAFYVGVSVGKGSAVYLVTAKHVIEGIRSLGADTVQLRINLKDGNSGWAPVPIANWLFHPSEPGVDVAVLPFTLKPEWDHLLLPEKIFLTKEMATKNGLGIGDEVFITGLFKHHKGQTRNIPICRVGNLAALDEEMIVTNKYGPIAGYLIEARSIGGISGSPVFVHFGSNRTVNGVTTLGVGSRYAFLGLIHGHFDVGSGAVDIAADSTSMTAQINTGIAIVIPHYKIKEVLDQPALVEMRTRLEAVSPKT
jgi:hypothetical protein